MAAYAALVSLLNTAEHIMNHHPVFASFHFYDFITLRNDFTLLLDFVENQNSYGGISKEEAEELETQIVSAAHEAEDAIESHLADQILAGKKKKFLLLNFFPFRQIITCIKDKVLEIKAINDLGPKYSAPAAPSAPFITTGKSSLVGFDDELMQLRDVLMGQRSSLQIVSVVGMGGAGKTTLAKYVYQDSLTMHHFEIRAWATISQEYSAREILSQLLPFQQKFTNERMEELGERLYKRLFGRRYLIILDDMWATDLWDCIKFFFPDNDEGSRVVLTTRLSSVAADLHCFCIRINFLDESSCWILFCQEVFGQEGCPPELVVIGKKIVEQCKGLPLSVVVIGGLLRKSFKTYDYWYKVAKNINSVLNSNENGQCLDVLYLSYKNLPAHLKPCFLYMGTYREDCEISVSEVIKLWVAEGFLKPNDVQMLEEIAEDYLKDLIDRNLVLVSARRSNGKIRSCRVHDLLRELCLKVANQEKFFHVVRADSILRGVYKVRRLIFHSNKVFAALQSVSLARTLICNMTRVPVNCKLLRVLNEVVDRSIEAKLINVNLRYIAYLNPAWSVLPSSISRIWNLQTLIIKSTEESDQVIVAPSEIWRMSRLRHIMCSRILLPDPPSTDSEDGSVVLENLQTLTTAVNFRLSEEACKRLAQIKKLSLTYGNMWIGYDDRFNGDLRNLCSLHKLESLHILCFNTISINELKNAFPSSLNKLSLTHCSVHWGDLSVIVGSLPVLEVLKLKKALCEVCSWSCVEGGFLSLKFLQIESCALKSWTSDGASCFPVLEKLILVDLWDLNEVPWSVGEIPTLQLIRLEDCTESSAISAMKINVEQEYYGNDGIQIQVIMSPGNSVGFRQMVKEKGLLVNNTHLQTWSEEDEDEDNED